MLGLDLLKKKALAFLVGRFGSFLGPFGFLLTLAVDLAFSRLVKPIYLLLIRKGVKQVRRYKGGKKADKLDKANTPDDYLDTLNKL